MRTTAALVLTFGLALAAAACSGPGHEAGDDQALAAQRQTSAAGDPAPDGTLEIYLVDVEGGKAVLFVAPSGESALIDTGNPGDRDVERIMAAVTDAGLDRIDYLISTHYHIDHIGGMQALAERIPIGTFVDHGPTVEEREQIESFQEAYARLRSEADHLVVSPGDTVPIAGLDWTIVTAAGRVLETPLPGGGQPNPHCADFEPQDNPQDENAQSVGSVVAFGAFRLIDLGDLYWDNEHALMCPTNPIGAVDLYITSHHGLASSGSEALVHAVQPRVAITQNGVRKGASVQVFDILHRSPRFEDLWQLHWSHNNGLEHNPAGVFIANVEPADEAARILTTPPPAPGAAPRGARRGPGHTGPADWISVSARADGSFTVTNSRNGFSRTYRPQAEGR